MSWLMTKAVLRSTSVPRKLAPSYVDAEKGFRKAYMQKYVEKETTIA